MKHLFIAALAAMITVFPALAENIDTDQEETKVEKTEKKKKNVTYNEKGEIIKTGLNFGPLPVVAFDKKMVGEQVNTSLAKMKL